MSQAQAQSSACLASSSSDRLQENSRTSEYHVPIKKMPGSKQDLLCSPPIHRILRSIVPRNDNPTPFRAQNVKNAVTKKQVTHAHIPLPVSPIRPTPGSKKIREQAKSRPETESYTTAGQRSLYRPPPHQILSSLVLFNNKSLTTTFH